MFPFIVGRRAVKVCTIHVFVQSERLSKCASKGKCANISVTYVGPPRGEEEEEECPVEMELACVTDGECSVLFHGVLKVELGPILGDVYEEFGYLRFAKGVLDLGPRNVYLLCDYQTVDECLKRHRSVVIDSNKPAVIEHSPGSDWGSARVLGVGNANVEFGDV
jgi:hypothetical protein